MRSAYTATLLLATAVLAQDPRPVNHLANETSPYLLQHAHNPVDWYPWGAAALAKAKKEDKPIFLSIGYAACHWCHVMERESFENEEIAKVLNEHFVCIKVDREERPDLDEIYMQFVQTTTGSGGWPMSVWLTAEGEPFFGGTYYPPDDRFGRPGFKRVLETLVKDWQDNRKNIEDYADRARVYLAQALAPEVAPGEPEVEWTDTLAKQSGASFDGEHGGFGQAPHFAPKFPHAGELSVLLRHHARTGDERSLAIAKKTLDAMVAGGMYDQIGGGFHRYSVDREWLVPHFEKMLYDNALLVRLYAEGFHLTGDPVYREIVVGTLDYLLLEMQDPAGGFHSSQDADSEGVEGKFFVWSEAEVQDLLGDDAAVAAARWGITEAGNWEHTNVLHRARTVAAVATSVGKEVGAVAQILVRCQEKLLAARGQRVRPGQDDKVLTAWNGLAIAACAVGYQTTGEQRYLEAGQRAATFCLTTMRRDGKLFRTWRAGQRAQAKLSAYLEDHAFLADGLLCLFEADGDPRWLEGVQWLLEQMQERFRDPEDGGFFFTAADHEALVARSKSVSESSIPSGTAMAAMAFLRSGLLFGSPELEEIGVAALRANAAVLERAPRSCPSLVLALQFHLGDPREVVIAGPADHPLARTMVERAWRAFPPHRVVAWVRADNRERLQALSPLFAGKVPVDGAPATYTCRRGVCEAPVLR